jgi:hypothetical protein
MRFAFTATLLTLASAASAAVIERQTGGILKCICFPDLYNDKGTLISTTTTTYTCAYAKGSCEWNQVRLLRAPSSSIVLTSPRSWVRL